MKILIIGGDGRFFYLAKILKSKGYSVLSYGLNCSEDLKIERVNSIKIALETSKTIIFPIPFTRDFKTVNLSCGGKISIFEVKKYLTKSHYVFGGCFSDEFITYLKSRNIAFYDYMKNVDFIYFNSLMTAEAAIAQAILLNPIDMHFSSCLVLGFGNCGRAISNKLKGLCSEVFVCVSNMAEKKLANLNNLKNFNISELKYKISNFNYIFNTIPVNFLCGTVLDCVNCNALILDITQNGLNLKECKQKSIKAEVSLSIPGRFKAISEAKFLANLTLSKVKK